MPLAPGLGPLSGRPNRADPRSGVRARSAPPIERRLASIAGFFAREVDMVEVARQLQTRHGIRSAQLMRLCPGDGAPAPSGKPSHRWSTRWRGGSQAGLGTSLALVCLAGLLAAVLALFWWSEFAGIPPAMRWIGLAVVPLLACLAVAIRVAAWPGRPNPRRFETNVQAQLAKGHWAVVVHQLPRERQSGVVALLRGCSLSWCAVVMPSRRL